MHKPAEWIPLSWPDESASLEWVRGSVVNCLVVPAPSEALTKRAAPLGIDVVTMSELESQVTLIRKAKWPRVPAARDGAGVSSGPTGAPWVDSNGWISALTRVQNPGKPSWVVTDPPADSGMLRSEAYQLAIADAAVYGSRWLISMDPAIRKAFAAGNSEALLTWQQISNATRFFDFQNLTWGSYQPVANLGVLSDFSGPNQALAGEVLNLCNRRYLPVRILNYAAVDAKSLEGLRAVVLILQREPDGRVQGLIGEFLRNGGLAIAPSNFAHMTSSLKPAGSFENSYDYFSHGKGRVAIARKLWNDPYQVATDSHLLMSRKHDVIRLWNAGSTNALYKAGPKGKGLVQVINYATRAFGHPVSLYVAHPYKSATVATISTREPEPLTVTPKAEGVEVNLPPFPVYSAIEFGE
jgi:hypothetical protein